MSPRDCFPLFYQRHHLLPQQPVFLAVSGGIDSVALCHAAYSAHLSFTLLHCNFGLRGEESVRDENFVRGLGAKYNVPVLVRHFDTEEYAQKEKLSVQEAARNLRYAWFRELIEDKKKGPVFLAHHADDNIETVLMNFFRGTGLEGLTGIKELSPDRFFARPFLHCTRADIEAYVQEEGLDWVEDSSNASNKYTRNFFRNELLPLVRKAYPEAEQNLSGNIRRFGQINALYQSSVETLRASLCEKKGPETWIPVRNLKKLGQPALVYELIKPFGFSEKQLPAVEDLLDAESGRYISNGQWQLVRHRNWLVIAPCSSEAATIVIDKDQDTIPFREGQLQLKISETHQPKPGPDPTKAFLDAASIEFPLLLRPWKQGDYFYPLGMRKKKKLARFLIDARLSKHQKETVWVIESNRRIIWVVGHRIDDRFKITEKTNLLLEITWDRRVVGVGV